MSLTKKHFRKLCDELRSFRTKYTVYYERVSESRRIDACPSIENVIFLKNGRVLSHRDFWSPSCFHSSFVTNISMSDWRKKGLK